MSRQPFSRPIQTRALSSVYGKIETLLLAFPGKCADTTKAKVLERYGPIFKAFNDRVTFVVLGDFGEDDKAMEASKLAFQEALSESNADPEHQLVFCHAPMATNKSLKDGKPHLEFVQDPMVVLESEYGEPVLLEPYLQANPRNDLVAEQLADYARYLIQPSSLEFEGGNILIGDDYALIGKNILLQNMEKAKRWDSKEPQKWIEREFKRILGVRFLLWVGMEKAEDMMPFHSTGNHNSQPFFHIDLFITLCGRSESGQEMVLLGQIQIDHVKGITEDEKKHLTKINGLLAETGEFLKESGKSRPGPRFSIRKIGIRGLVTGSGPDRCFIPESYNNAHVEWINGRRTIYFPSYESSSDLEESLKTLLARHNFNPPVFIKGQFNRYAEQSASLHCITKVLARRNF